MTEGGPISEQESRFSQGLALAIRKPNPIDDLSSAPYLRIIEPHSSFYRSLLTRARYSTQPRKDPQLKAGFPLFTRFLGPPGQPRRPINCSHSAMQCFCH